MKTILIEFVYGLLGMALIVAPIFYALWKGIQL